jgi:hypothetical protein
MNRVLIALLIALVSTQAAMAATTITSSQFQVETSGMVDPNMLITGSTPWDFTGENYLSLTSIDEISVTLQLLDGDTDTGDYDISQLVLELDGFNTSLVLDGFTNDLVVTHTVSGANQAAGLLSALQVDGYLLGSILDLSPNDNYVKVMTGYSATLSLTDHEVAVVPAPGALLLSSLGVAATAALNRRRLLRV